MQQAALTCWRTHYAASPPRRATSGLVQAKSEAAKQYYLACAGFVEFLADSQTMFVGIKTISHAIGAMSSIGIACVYSPRSFIEGLQPKFLTKFHLAESEFRMDEADISLKNNSLSPPKAAEPVQSLEEFMHETGKLMRESGLRQTTGSLWWRGQGDESWPLTPSLYRSRINSEYEREITRDFRLKSLPFLRGIAPVRNVEWLFLMQHHGAPTRILDWSESPLVALYFCVLNFDDERDGAVWYLHPWSLNLISNDFMSAPTVDSPVIKKYVIDFDSPHVPRGPSAELPIATRIEYGFNRAHSQRGAATIHGFSKKPLEQLRFEKKQGISNTKIDKMLGKIIIKGREKFNIMKSLYEFGIGSDTMFPDLDGLASALRFRYDHRYLNEKLK